MSDDARAIIRGLDLKPHPEGGHYRETYRATASDGGRGAMTAIYYLLQAGEISAWHRIDAAEIWHYYAGAPLVLTLSSDGRTTAAIQLGPNLKAGQVPQAIVPPMCWQTAKSMSTWTLVGCTVGPAFSSDGFELAPAGWRPGP